MSKEEDDKLWRMFMFGVAYTQTHPDMKLLKDWTDEEEALFRKSISETLKEHIAKKKVAEK
jgi:hypothetical protein